MKPRTSWRGKPSHNNNLFYLFNKEERIYIFSYIYNKLDIDIQVQFFDRGSQMRIVFPGEKLSDAISETLEERQKLKGTTASVGDAPLKVQLGSGLIQASQDIISLKAGQLSFLPPSKFSVVSPQRRYVPQQNDLVIGIVTVKLAEMFRVDIGAAQPATLSILNGFEAATRKNKPNFAVGTVIFARVAVAHPDLEPELACFDPHNNIPVEMFGELKKTVITPSGEEKATEKIGHLIRTSCDFARSLQRPDAPPILESLGKFFAFEVAAGANGRVYLEAADLKETLLLANLLEAAGREGWDRATCQQIAKQIAEQCGKTSSNKKEK